MKTFFKGAVVGVLALLVIGAASRVTYKGVFIGDGASITNLSATGLPAGIVTNNDTRNLTFTGNISTSKTNFANYGWFTNGYHAGSESMVVDEVGRVIIGGSTNFTHDLLLIVDSTQPRLTLYASNSPPQAWMLAVNIDVAEDHKFAVYDSTLARAPFLIETNGDVEIRFGTIIGNGGGLTNLNGLVVTGSVPAAVLADYVSGTLTNATSGNADTATVASYVSGDLTNNTATATVAAYVSGVLTNTAANLIAGAVLPALDAGSVTNLLNGPIITNGTGCTVTAYTNTTTGQVTYGITVP